MSFSFLLAYANLETRSASASQERQQTELQHEAIAVNIEVPVRVFKKKNFVGDLAIGDFEIYEDGVLQDIEAMYLIQKTDIARRRVHHQARGGPSKIHSSGSEKFCPDVRDTPSTKPRSEMPSPISSKMWSHPAIP